MLHKLKDIGQDLRPNDPVRTDTGQTANSKEPIRNQMTTAYHPVLPQTIFILVLHKSEDIGQPLGPNDPIETHIEPTRGQQTDIRQTANTTGPIGNQMTTTYHTVLP